MQKRQPDPEKLTPKKRSPPPKPSQKSMDIEKAMQVLLAQGFTIKPPDLIDHDHKHNQTQEALGIIEHNTVTPKRLFPTTNKSKKKEYTIELSFPHTINGIVYGPGLVVISDIKLLENLANKDHISKDQENRTFESTSRCHLIVNRVDSYGRQAAYGQPVDERYFNTGAALMNAPIFKEFSHSDVSR